MNRRRSPKEAGGRIKKSRHQLRTWESDWKGGSTWLSDGGAFPRGKGDGEGAGRLSGPRAELGSCADPSEQFREKPVELRLPVDGRCAEKCEKGRLTCVAAAARVIVYQARCVCS